MQKISKVEVRKLHMDDYAQLAQSFTRVYADKDVFWTHQQIKKLIQIFPEGQIVTVVNNKIVWLFRHCSFPLHGSFQKCSAARGSVFA